MARPICIHSRRACSRCAWARWCVMLAGERLSRAASAVGLTMDTGDLQRFRRAQARFSEAMGRAIAFLAPERGQRQSQRLLAALRARGGR
jgi:hypothetical protein